MRGLAPVPVPVPQSRKTNRGAARVPLVLTLTGTKRNGGREHHRSRGCGGNIAERKGTIAVAVVVGNFLDELREGAFLDECSRIGGVLAQKKKRVMNN